MTSGSFNIEDYISDVSNRAILSSGVHYCSDIVQVVKDDGINDVNVEHSFYSITDLGVKKKLGGISFTEEGGSVSMSFDVTNDSGITESILGISANGLDISGGNASFGTSSVEVEDIDIVLASTASVASDLNNAGIILGTSDSGEIKLIYSQLDDFWTTNTGVNVESGKAFTVDADKVVLDESGLKIEDIVLSQTGLTIGTEVSITSSNIILGSTDPVVLDSSGLSVGSTLSLDTTNGLLAGDITLNSTDGLVIGSGTTALILDSSGLNVGSDLTLDSTGLFVGDTEFSVANGLVFDSVKLQNTGLTFEDTLTGDVVVDQEGIYIGDDISLTKTGGLSLGSSSTLNATSISFGTSPDETVVDDTGVYLKNNTSAIYMGDSNQWKIVFDSSSQNLQFQFFDTSSSAYVIKAEMKST